MKILVLGAGLVGGPIALDLAQDPKFEVTVADINVGALQKLAHNQQIYASTPPLVHLSARPPVRPSAPPPVHSSARPPVRPSAPPPLRLSTLHFDLNNPDSLTRLASGFDMVVNAVPGFMGFQTLKAIIEAGKNVVDIAFFIEDPFQLDELAKKKGVTAIMDIGVAPGMCNVLIGYAHHLLDETERVEYYVGGLPEIREWPYEYKAVFSPIDVIEEYTRPARYIENGHLIVKPALSDPELMDFPGVGTLESFNTDGLRSLAHTIKCPNMKEKTLRYPGHIEKMRLLRETGFFGYDPVEVQGQQVRPIDLTAKLLFPKWKLKEGEVDITVMKVIVEGKKSGEPVCYIWNLLDRYDPETRIHSMARTTGYTATVALRMIADGLYTRKGISVPEFIGEQPECVEYMLRGLKERGVVYRECTNARMHKCTDE